MLKALFKKQFLEIFARFFMSEKYNKKNKNTSSKSRQQTGMLLLIFIVIGIIAGVGWLANTLSGMLLPEYDILYFTIFGILTVVLAFALSVFISSTTLFGAKDNELLLSLPIPSRRILISRMSILMLFCVGAAILLWVPAVVVYAISGYATGTGIIFSLLNLINMSLLVIAISCLIGWIVSLISRFAKFKKIAAILGMLILICVWFAFNQVIRGSFEQLQNNLVAIDDIFKTTFFPLYAFGESCSGDIVSFLIVTAVCVGLFVINYIIISATFVKMLTSKRHSKRKQYVAKDMTKQSVDSALLKKEFKLYGHYTAYIVNTCLGIFFMVIACVAAFVFKDNITQFITILKQFGLGQGFVAIVVFCVVGFCIAVNYISEPSVSMEGNTCWILKTLPVSPLKILTQKMNVHIIINGIPAIIISFILCFMFSNDPFISASCVAVTILFVLVTAQLGMIFGTRRANLEWTNPAVPIKTNIGVVLVLLVGILVVIGYGVLYFACLRDMPAYAYNGIWIVVFLIASIIFNMVIKKVSVKDFLTA